MMAVSSVAESLGMKFPPMFIAEGEKTFQYQGDLPSLPIPPLNQTLVKYLDSVKPHLSGNDYQKTAAIVEEFERGIGKTLHEELCLHAKHKRNWIEAWWEKYAYLMNREPHAPLVNFSGPGPYIFDVWKPEPGTQIERAAITIWLTLHFWNILRKEQFKVDRGGLKEKRVWCMYQFHRMFSSCKTPGETMDILNDYFKTEAEGDTPHHITVQAKGRIFSLEVLDDNGEIFTPAEFEQQLQAIVSSCSSQQDGPSVGALTGMKRTDYYHLHGHLLSIHPDNPKLMEIVKSSVFNLALDDAEPNDIEELTRESILGDSSNRWFDKSFTFILYKNGTVGCNCDHAPHDAMIMVVQTSFNYMTVLSNAKWKHAPHDAMVMVVSTYWAQLCLDHLKQQDKLKSLMSPTTVRALLPAPQELAFHVDNRILQGVQQAKQVYAGLCKNIQVNIRIFEGYGRKLLRQHKVVPDTHMQLNLQLAYYRMHGKPAPTYETASTRKYFHGRTETVRSCTPEVMRWAKTMLDPLASMDQKLSLYKEAHSKHNTLMAECQEAEGCDRHLFGLQCIANESGRKMPEIFTDPAWVKSGGGGNYILSSSFVGYTAVFGGVAPMCKDGYGFFYSIMPKQACCFIVSWNSDESTDNERLYANMVKSLTESRRVLEYAAAKL